MTRKEFDDAMVVALRDMGDDSFEHNDPNWDDDYSKMKKLSPNLRTDNEPDIQ